jgi:hypothetical protein
MGVAGVRSDSAMVVRLRMDRSSAVVSSVLRNSPLHDRRIRRRGVVPYGYRKQGDRNAARIVLSEEPILGLPLSEAAVIATIFRLCAIEKKSCQKIADHLNHTGVPCGRSRVSRFADGPHVFFRS